jgi:hypothetical protein
MLGSYRQICDWCVLVIESHTGSQAFSGQFTDPSIAGRVIFLSALWVIVVALRISSAVTG